MMNQILYIPQQYYIVFRQEVFKELFSGWNTYIYRAAHGKQLNSINLSVPAAE
jgi:hypothetical protein